MDDGYVLVSAPSKYGLRPSFISLETLLGMWQDAHKANPQFWETPPETVEQWMARKEPLPQTRDANSI